MRKANSVQLPASFRDPNGFLFQLDGIILVFNQEFHRYFIIDDSVDIRKSQRTPCLICANQR